MCEVEEVILDKGPWYRDALQRLGVRFSTKYLERGAWLNQSFLLSNRELRFSSVPLRLTSRGRIGSLV